MGQVSFRAAKPSALPAIIAMLAEDPLGSQREVAGLPPDRRYVEAFEAIRTDPNQLLVVAADAGAVVGTLQLSFIPGLSRTGTWRGQIEGVRITAARRGEGLGERMVAWAIAACRERGCGLVQLTTDGQRTEAHRFYEKLGFVASHAGYKLALSSV